ncbi:MAG: NADH:ubiquinone reductase (Na(+)-transporting) subunit C [Bacteroidales bacterium]|nr:NADH:ubiquinone reductase (Na(+)-transporting) subunit C [Bacteroidota bacterium]MBL6949219.1 NADH:ubiquinone reductase (Na(+)-transporting) subunit C [Bacteroidales bacterium]
MFSNRYIFIYSTVMVIIVAAVLSSTAILLQPRQEKNKTIANIQGILAAVNIEATSDNAEELYQQFVKTELGIDQYGQVTSVYRNGMLEEGEVRPFDIDLKKEHYNKRMGNPFLSPLFIAEIEGDTLYIIPMRGVGLWGPLYGNVAFGPDFNKIVGADFSHDKETPGLGAEISDNTFSDQFIGKMIFDDAGKFNSVMVVKGGPSTLPPAMEIHGVDAISGGTITSNGVNDMIENCLENYMLYIQNNN